MDRGAWRATVHGLTGVRHDLATKQQKPSVSVLKSVQVSLQQIGMPCPWRTGKSS